MGGASVSGGLAAAALAAGLAPGAPQQARVEGAIAVTWRGDPARCAAAGLCDVAGSAVYRPVGADPAGPPELTHLGLRVATDPLARVHRREPGLPEGLCTDVATLHPNGSRSGQRVRLRLSGTELYAIGGRCAGPLGRDVEAAMPVAAIDPRDPDVLDFRGRGTFSAGPLAGEVDSTLVVRRWRTAPAARAAAAPPPRRRIAIYELAYRVVGASGTVGLEFRGASDPSCRPVDACGVTGMTTHSPGLARTTIGLRITRPLRRRERPGSLRAALRRDGLALSGGVRDRDRTGRTSSVVARAGGATCRDTVAGPALPLSFGGAGGRLAAEILARSEPAGSFMDPARTRCPGPPLEGTALAAGRIPANALAERRLRLTLTARGGVAGPGYVGASRGRVVLELRRTRTRIRTGRGPR